MFVQVLSDLHMEHQMFTLKVNPKADVLVLAGDIVALELQCKKLYHIETLIKNVKIPVVMITGNHEYYGYGKVSTTNAALKGLEAKYPHFHFLDNAVWVYRDVEFIGSTLWSNFDIAPNKITFVSRIPQAIGDFITILSENVGLITAQEMIALNLAARAFIDTAVMNKTNLKKVVITHFVPTEEAISEQYRGNALNPYFVCNCEQLMPGVHTWIFGHTHTAFDFQLRRVHSSGHVLVDTHMVCNPRGYPSEGTGFDSQKLIEV